MAHNSTVIEDPPVPPARADGSADVVSDDDRNRYGKLLDSALERGLLGVTDYEIGLRALGAATTIGEMQRVVTELPVFTVLPPGASTQRSRPARGLPARRAGSVGQHRAGRWKTLVAMVVVMVAVLVFLSLYAQHVVHGRTNGSGLSAPTVTAVATVTAAAAVSPVRPLHL